MNLQKITITKSSLYFRECKACGCVTHIGKTTPVTKS
nr:MAG TPA: putative translation initiation factor 2 [Caudoviricetes sp.]